jgi:hypothetical protein
MFIVVNAECKTGMHNVLCCPGNFGKCLHAENIEFNGVYILLFYMYEVFCLFLCIMCNKNIQGGSNMTGTICV